MSTSVKDGLDYILQAINNLIEPKLEKLRYDKTYRAKVTAIIGGGLYEVQIKDKKYTVGYGGALSIGDIVKVKAPLNNFSDIYIEGAQNSGGGVTGDTLPVGSIMPYPKAIAPENWLVCDGSAVSRTDYSELFSAIGTTFGVGDGSTTFNLPNIKGKTIVGLDSSDTDFNEIGKTLGEKTHTLTVAEMASHNHELKFMSTGSGSGAGVPWSASNNFLGNDSSGCVKTGGDQPHNNIQPSFISCYMIKAKQSAGVVATVVDSLTSTSKIDAVSANQARILNEKINGIVLYEDETGSKDEIFLSDTVLNYDRIKIYYHYSYFYGSVEVDNANNKTISLSVAFSITQYNLSRVQYKDIKINGNKITNTGYGYLSASTAGTLGVSIEENEVYIDKVVGYK